MTFVSLVIVVVVAFAVVLWVFQGNLSPPPTEESGFSVVSLNEGTVLLSDGEVLAFNVTSQEIALTEAASQRLQQAGLDLYNFTNTVAIRVNGEEIYHGIFRSAVMSAVPSLPKIAILYPSIDYSSGVENNHAIRLFYPSFEPPSSLTEMNAKFTQYFQDAGKLVS